MKSIPEAPRRAIARSTLLTAILSALWLIVVYATQVLLAALFGAGKEMDAYLAATSVPMLITALAVESVNLAFVPTFVEHQTRGDPETAWRIAGILLSGILFVLGSLTLVGVLFSPFLMRVLVPGFDPERMALATDMSRIIFPSSLLLGVAGFLNSLHYAQKEFLIPALSPLANALTNLAVILVLVPVIGIYGSAWGSLAGPLAQCVLAAPILFRSDIRLNVPTLREPGVQEIVRMIGWRVLGDAAGKGTPIVDRIISSALAVGAISYLGYGWRIVTLALGLIGQPINTVLLPFFYERAVETNRDAMGRAVSVGMRMTALIALPLSALVIVLSEPIVRVLFQRGQFDASTTRAVALVIAAYAGVWLSHSLTGPIVPALYALKQMRLVSLVELVGVAVYLLAAVTLPRMFDFLGLAFALSLNYIFNAVIYAYFLFCRLRVPFDAQITRFCFKCGVATLAASAVAWSAYGEFTRGMDIERYAGPSRAIGDATAIACATILALGAYLLTLVSLRSPELVMLWRALSKPATQGAE
jgi:putative peptidoglycan lipid II flippase